MNKEVIKKFKPEFDHWLNGGELLYWSGIQWDKVLNGFNWYTMGPIIINDEYAEFRKALAEGKVVEFSTSRHLEDIWHTLETPMFNEDYKYRIKPDEPEFKVGDWITIEGTLPKDKFKLTEKEIKYGEVLLAHFSFTEDTWKHWKPQPGEHIWDNTYGLSVVENVSLEEGVLCRECFNGKVLFTPTMKEVEPFIGILPSFTEKFTRMD